MDLGKSLRVAMALRGVKNKEVAEALSCASSQISNWVKYGNLTRQNIEQMCEFFEMPASEFVRLGE